MEEIISAADNASAMRARIMATVKKGDDVQVAFAALADTPGIGKESISEFQNSLKVEDAIDFHYNTRSRVTTFLADR